MKQILEVATFSFLDPGMAEGQLVLSLSKGREYDVFYSFKKCSEE